LRQPFIGSAQSAHFGGFGRVGGQGLLGIFLLGIEPLGVDVQDAGVGKRGAAFAGQPQSFCAEGRIITWPFRREKLLPWIRGINTQFSSVSPDHLKPVE